METLKQEELVHIDLWAVVRRMMPILRRLWALILALAVLFGGLMAIRSLGSYVPMYRSEAMFSVSLNTTGESSATAIRFGMAIRPFSVSAISHSSPRSTVAPRMATRQNSTV